MIRVFIADDYVLIREGLRKIFSGCCDQIEVVGEAANGLAAVAAVQELRPDVVLLDIVMPGINGFEVTRRIKRASSGTVNILILSQYDTWEYLSTVLEAGASGYILKDVGESELCLAIQTVAQGKVYLSSEMTQHLISKLVKKEPVEKASVKLLTAREREVLGLTAEGLRTKDIAAKLFISGKTVQTHLSSILDKLELNSRTELVKYAINEGIISLQCKSDRSVGACATSLN